MMELLIVFLSGIAKTDPSVHENYNGINDIRHAQTEIHIFSQFVCIPKYPISPNIEINFVSRYRFRSTERKYFPTKRRFSP